MIDIKNDAYVERMIEKMKNNGEVENEYITDEEENEDSEDSDYWFNLLKLLNIISKQDDWAI